MDSGEDTEDCWDEASEQSLDEVNSVRTIPGHPGLDARFRHIKECIINGADLASPILKKVNFLYKDNEREGRPIHIAALHPKGYEILEQLLQLRADIHDVCSFSSFGGKVGTVQPIHLAATSGNLPMIRGLLQHRADVAAQATFDGAYHFEPIHDAAFHSQVDATNLLLENLADPNKANKDGLTPLHVCAKQGCVAAAQKLLLYGARPETQNNEGETPLQVALKGDSWPDDALHLLGTRKMEELMRVAKVSQSSAILLVRQWGDEIENATNGQTKEDSVCSNERRGSQQWVNSIGGINPRQWMELAFCAPSVAEEVLDAVTVCPQVINQRRHPMPKSASLKSSMLTHYDIETEWSYDVAERDYPPWHDRIAPSKSKGGSVEIRIRLIHIPNLICLETLFTLVEGSQMSMFSKIAIQAVIKCAWIEIARYYYYVLLAMRCAMLFVLFQTAFFPPETLLVKQVYWSLGAVVAGIESISEISEMCGYVFILRHPWNYFASYLNCWDLLGHSLNLFLWWWVAGSFELSDQPELFAIVSLYYWLHTINSLRAFPNFGHRILPILHSFKAMIPMLIITAFLFVAFFHTCAILEPKDSDTDQYTGLFLQSFRLFFANDGDGIDHVLQLGDRGDSGDVISQALLVGAVVGFCICMLNLFIAVHGEAYDTAQEYALPLFAKERASICLKIFLVPHWYGRYIHCWRTALVAIFLITIVIWVFMLFVFGLYYISTVILLCGLLLCQAIFLQRPWRRIAQDQQDYFLWVSFKKDWQSGSFWPAASEDDVKGRMAKFKSDICRVEKEITEMRQYVGCTVNKCEKNINKRLQSIEAAIRESKRSRGSTSRKRQDSMSSIATKRFGLASTTMPNGKASVTNRPARPLISAVAPSNNGDQPVLATTKFI